MRANRLVLVVTVVVGLVSAVEFLRHYPQLPVRMATHFDAAGRANGWMSKAEFAGFQLVLLGFFGVLFGWLPRLLYWLPSWSINVPHRAY